MFVENHRRIEGKFVYRSWFTNSLTECRTIIIKRENETKVIVFQKYRCPGTSPTNCYEDIATGLYFDRLSKTDIQDIKWFLYYEEANTIYLNKTNILEWELNAKRLFRMEMEWQKDHFEDGSAEFIAVREEEILGVLEMTEYPSVLFCKILPLSRPMLREFKGKIF